MPIHHGPASYMDSIWSIVIVVAGAPYGTVYIPFFPFKDGPYPCRVHLGYSSGPSYTLCHGGPTLSAPFRFLMYSTVASERVPGRRTGEQ